MGRVWLIVGIGVAGLAALVIWLAGERPGTLESQGGQINLVYLILLLVLVASSLIVRWRTAPTLQWLRHGLLWSALFLVLITGYSFHRDLGPLWKRVVAELMPGSAVEVTTGTVTVRAGEDDHFRIDTNVDGAALHMLVDTGASTVVLNRRDARKIGFALDRLSYDRRTQTANGIGLGASVRLREIRIRSIVVRDVPALVNQAPMSTSLLGMSFLGRLSAYSVKDGTLTLVQ